ncbi:MAG: efflux RND transporter periplasmic adaptor subunit [Bacteroidales bacterium]
MKDTYQHTKKWLIGSIAIIGIFALGFVTLQILESQKSENKQRIQKKDTPHVLIKPVKYTNHQTDISGSGQLQTYSELDIVSEAVGKLHAGSIPLKEGTTFQKGDILAHINTTETKYALQAQKSSFIASFTRVLPDIEIDFPTEYTKIEKFTNSLSSNKTFPELPEFSQKKIEIFLASKGILSEYYSIKKMEYTLSKHTIHAPFSGTIKMVYNQPGAYMNPGNKIISIMRNDIFEVEVPVDIKKATWIQPGQSVRIFSNESTRTWNGKVARIANHLNPQTQARSVYITTQNDGTMISGEYVTVSITGEVIKNVFKIPRNALLNDSTVYSVKNGKLQKTQITITKSGNDFFLIQDIPENDSVIIEPLIHAKENMNVNTYTR